MSILLILVFFDLLEPDFFKNQNWIFSQKVFENCEVDGQDTFSPNEQFKKFSQHFFKGLCSGIQLSSNGQFFAR